MGGQRGGGVAARLVVGLLPALLERVGASTPGYPADAEATRGVIRRAVLAANAEVRARGAHNPDLRGLGATLALVLLGGASAHVAHLGDSRVYLHAGARPAPAYGRPHPRRGGGARWRPASGPAG